MERLFTIEEANRLVPHLKKLVRKVIRERAALIDIQGEIQRARDNAQYGGGSLYGMRYLEGLKRFSEAVHSIEELGVLVKDLQKGLCDFPHERDGRLVYLCWKLDEDEVQWWHEVEDGFIGRQPLEAKDKE